MTILDPTRPPRPPATWWCLTFEVDQSWACMDPDITVGNLDAHGCDVGCDPCIDDLDQIYKFAALPTGRRWMAPGLPHTSRDATGNWPPIRSEIMLRYPILGTFIRAPCWSNGGWSPGQSGEEFYAGDVLPGFNVVNFCDCHPELSVVIDDETGDCEPGGIVPHQPIPGMHADCEAFYDGYNFEHITGPTSWLQCRSVRQTENVKVIAVSKRLFQAIFMRSGKQCAPNRMIACAAGVYDSECESSLSHQENAPPWYNDNPCRVQNFAIAHIDMTSAPVKLVETQNYAPLQDKSLTELKNKALALVRTEAFPDGSVLGVRFDQLDYRATESGPGFPTAHNNELDYWRRFVDSREQPLQDLVKVADLVGTRWNFGEMEEIEADLVVTKVGVEMSLVPYRKSICTAWHLCGEKETIPHARIRIQVDLRVRVHNVAGFEYSLIPNPGIPARKIQFRYKRDNAPPESEPEPLEPPSMAEWWGFLGESSVPAAENIETSDPGPGTIWPQCQHLARDMSTIEIPPWPYTKDSNPNLPNTVYKGKVKLGFDDCGNGGGGIVPGPVPLGEPRAQPVEFDIGVSEEALQEREAVPPIVRPPTPKQPFERV